MTDRLRIVVPRYGSGIGGGSETAMRRLAGALEAKGWTVEVWTTTAADDRTWRGHLPPGRSRDGGVTVRRFAVVVPRPHQPFAQMSRIFWQLPGRLRPERAWLAAQGPWSPALVHALKGTADGVTTLFTPYLYHPTVRGLPATPGPRILLPAAHDEWPLRLRAVRDCVAASGALWYHSAEERQLMIATHPVAATKPDEVGTAAIQVPEGVDSRRFGTQRGIGKPYLLAGGRRSEGKGLEQLLAAFRLLRARRDVAMVLTGDAGTGVVAEDVISTGVISEAQLWDAIAGAAAVVVPGVLESLSLMALEAWAVGRPTLVPAASAVLRGQTERSGGGLLYGDAEDFALQATRLVDDAGLAGRLGASGRAHVAASYRWDGVEARLRRLIAAAAA